MPLQGISINIKVGGARIVREKPQRPTQDQSFDIPEFHFFPIFDWVTSPRHMAQAGPAPVSRTG